MTPTPTTMPSTDPRIDAYIAKSAPFAQPILRHVRELIHAACPEVEETIKWGMPFFEYHGILANMAAFKAHCSVGFWRGKVALGDAADPDKRDGMGHLGKITSLNDLPSDREFTRYVKRGAEYNREHEGAPKATSRKPKPAAKTPAYLTAALSKNKKAREQFEAMAPSKRRDYIEWLVEAKTEETRARRLKQTVEQVAQGKGRNWKYEEKMKSPKAARVV